VIKKRASTLAGIAVMYAMLGALALVFPGPVFGEYAFAPAAAVALYAALRHGDAAALPILVAAMAVGLLGDPAFADAGRDARLGAQFLLAFAAAMQALLGARLVRRQVPHWQSLTRPMDGLRMLLFAVVLPTLPWALMRVGLRVLMNDVHGSVGGMFCAAWLAQMIGMVALLPVLFTLGFRRSPLWQARLRSLTLPACVLVLLVLGAQLFATRLEAERRAEIFAGRAAQTQAALNAVLRDHLMTVVATTRFIEAAPTLTRDAFIRFCEPLLQAREGLRALAWVPRLEARGRDLFVLEARNEHPGYLLQELGAGGALTPAAERAVYFPVRYVVPQIGNETVLGFDLASEPSRRWALDLAQRNNKLVVTAPIDLVDSKGPATGVLAIVPVHRFEGRYGLGHDLNGVAVVALNIVELVESTLSAQLVAGMSARLVDMTHPSDPIELFEPQRAAGSPMLTVALPVPMENRHWRLEVMATSDFDEGRAWVVLWLVMGGSFILLGLLQGYLLVTSGQTVAVNLEVGLHTRQLREEVEKREAVAATLRESEARMRGVFDTVIDGLVIIDTNGIIDAFNPAAERIFGWKAAEVIGRNVSILMPEPYHSEHDRYLADYQRTGHRRIIGIGRTVQGRRKDGSVFPLDLSVSPFALGDRMMFAGVTRDATDRVASAAQIKEFNEQLRGMVVALEQRDRALTELTRVNEELMACNDRSEAAGVIERAMNSLFPGSAGMLAVSAGRAAGYRLDFFVGWGGHAALARQIHAHDCWALRQGRAHVFAPGHSQLRCPHVAAGFGDYTCLPLVVQGQVQGLITISLAPVEEAQALERRRLLETLGESIKLSLSNLALRELLRDQVMRDPLTRLYNRRYMEEALMREAARARRDGSPMGCALIDLDHFKRINDTHGHDVGDAVLRGMADALQGWFRSSDTVCRYGGEEFVVIFPAPDPEATRERLLALQQAFARRAFQAGEAILSNCTFSAGLVVDGGEALDPHQLLKAADAALYEAKQAGRNRVVLRDLSRGA
jgi:diguanylate cyclase (GGDEF)-like protein/PAS domain S-box-containing protein